MIEIFRNTNYDFLGKKWLCIGLSCLLLLLGVASIAWRAVDGNPSSHPFNMGVDFTGGTIVNAKFNKKPDPGVIRAAIEKQGIDGSKITIQPVGEEIGQAPKNEVLIRLPNIPVTEGQGGQSGEAQSAESKCGQLKSAKAAEAQDKQSGKAKSNASVDLGQRKIRDALCALNDPTSTPLAATR
jgi:preprotein translocase subunit SecF